MSGSVCNDNSGSECIGCKADRFFSFLAFLPSFFPQCRDGSVDEDTCCENFAKVKDFSSALVGLLDRFPATKSFAVVQFATHARLARGPSPAARATEAIDRLDYTGGLTNHAAAIWTCRRNLPARGDAKNLIVLVTDGVSSEPGFDPAREAEETAASAKRDGIHVVPVFISGRNEPSALSFMKRLSSDGEVFDVTDFDGLDSLQGRLVDQVSCS